MQLFVQLFPEILGEKQLNVELSGWGIMIDSGQRLLQTVAQNVTWHLYVKFGGYIRISFLHFHLQAWEELLNVRHQPMLCRI